MIDALRKDAWPRGVRRQRRELEAAREELRRELGCEPSLADLAAKVGSDEKRLGRTIVRINAIESTSPLANNEHLDESTLPAALIPSEPEQPDTAYEREETTRARARGDRVAAAARAEGHRPLLLRRGDDEADWRRDRRQRVARLAAARARHPPAARCARHDGAGGRSRHGDAQRDPRVPEAEDGEGDAREPRRGVADGDAAPASSCLTRAFRGRRAASRRAGTAWRASGSRCRRESARRRCRRRRR